MRLGRLLAPFLVMLILGSCASPRVLAPPPALYNAENPYPQDLIPEALRQSQAEIIFVTDRVWDEQSATFVPARSRAMSVGEVTVDIGSQMSWGDLMALTSGAGRGGDWPELSVRQTRIDIVFPATPIPFSVQDGMVIERADVALAYQASVEAFRDMVRQRLIDANTDTVLIYVHGFNNGFDDAAFDLTDIWHYSGRGSVPIAFSWPTVEGNLLGYFAARESGDFSIYHLKEAFRALQGIPELTTINVIAHSRGVDVSTTAIRELIIEVRGSGRSPRDVLKINNLILAAADLDTAVAGQRLAAERFAVAVGQITMYSNPGDAALRLSSLVSSGLRVGETTLAEYEEDFSNDLAGIENIAFVDVSSLSGEMGHNYFRRNPSVIADIALILQSDAGPGASSRRLKYLGGNFYSLTTRETAD